MSNKLPPPIAERNLRPLTIKCQCCGVERPTSDYKTDKRSKTGYALICKACQTQRRKNALAQAGAAAKEHVCQRTLEDFTAVELMKELARRGYDGELTVTERKTVRIKEL